MEKHAKFFLDKSPCWKASMPAFQQGDLSRESSPFFSLPHEQRKLVHVKTCSCWRRFDLRTFPATGVTMGPLVIIVMSISAGLMLITAATAGIYYAHKRKKYKERRGMLQITSTPAHAYDDPYLEGSVLEGVPVQPETRRPIRNAEDVYPPITEEDPDPYGIDLIDCSPGAMASVGLDVRRFYAVGWGRTMWDSILWEGSSMGSISAAQSGPAFVPPRIDIGMERRLTFPSQRLVTEPRSSSGQARRSDQWTSAD